MKVQLSAILITIPALLFTGCTSTYLWEEDSDISDTKDNLYSSQQISQNYDKYPINVSDSAKFTDEFKALLIEKEYKNSVLTNMKYMSQESQNPINKGINFYVRGLMQDMIANVQFVNETTPIAVTSFVLLNSDLNQTNILGNQIAESLIHEIHKFGIPIIDFKTTDYIRITNQGDFTFSRDYQELRGDLPIRYVVSGTLLKQHDGYLVNARIVGVSSKAVVATAQNFIPLNVVKSIIDNVNVDESLSTKSVSIIQG